MTIDFVPAEPHHVPEIAALLSDDILGAGREAKDGDLAVYETAFERIEADPNITVWVGLDGKEVVATFHLIIIHCMAIQGTTRAEIEAVRVRSDKRGSGLGDRVMSFAIETARAAGARLVQLTSNKARPDAHRFYQRHGFEATHAGFKLYLK